MPVDCVHMIKGVGSLAGIVGIDRPWAVVALLVRVLIGMGHWQQLRGYELC